METMQLLVEDEFYPEIMAFLEPLVEERKIEILDNYWEPNEEQKSCSLHSDAYVSVNSEKI